MKTNLNTLITSNAFFKLFSVNYKLKYTYDFINNNT